MAFNWQTFRVRTISSFIFVAVMLGGLLWNQWSFLVLFSIIHFGCWREYLRLVEKIYNTVFHPYTKLGLMVMGYGLMLWFCGPSHRVNGYGLKENFSLPLSAAGFALLITGIFQKTSINPKAFGIAAAGLLYISLSWGFLLDLYRSFDIHIHDTMFVTGNLFFPVATMVSIWMNDTMAYLVGSLIGKTPLTKISPKKTWEGTIGGVIMGLVITSLLMVFVFFPGDRLILFIVIPIALLASITGTFGDLLESKLKRMAGVKDSGQMLPGHGGFMDRFDSVLIAVPFVWLCVRIFL